jgi:hypothetical protein
MNQRLLVVLLVRVVAAAAAPAAFAAAACDTLPTCHLRNLASGVEVNLKTTPFYQMDATNKVGYSIRCTLANTTGGGGTVNYVKFLYNGLSYDVYAEPRWMNYYGSGPNGDYIAPVPYLDSCGSKTVQVQGHTWEAKCFDQAFTFTAQCGTPAATDKAPAAVAAAAAAPKAAPSQPVAVAQPTAMAGTCDALATCYLRNINAKTEIDLSTTTTYALDLIHKDKNCYSIRCETKKTGELNFLKFSYDGTTHDSFDEPRWMSYYGTGPNGDYVEKVPYLGTCGTKTVKLSGQTWSRVCFEKTWTLTALCGPTAPSPKAVAQPVVTPPQVAAAAAPKSSPVVQPAPPAVPKALPQSPPVAASVPTTPLASCGGAAVQSCVVRNLATKASDVNVLNYSSYPVDPNNKVGYSLLCKVSGNINLVKYLYDGQVFDAFAEPRWMSYYGNSSGGGGEYIAPVPYLATCGAKTIKVQGHTWSSMCVEKVLTLTATCNGAPTPVAAPTPATTPVAPRDQPSLCPAGYKMVSNACVKDWCQTDYVCPPGSGRIPDRECYNDKKDCACIEGYVSRLGFCLKSRLSRSCPYGRYWWGSCKRRNKTLRINWNPFN